MFLTVALLLATPQGCIDTKTECRACTVTDGKRQCSTPGIACQPLERICRPKNDLTAAQRPKSAKTTRK